MPLVQFVSPTILLLALLPLPLISFLSEGRTLGLNFIVYGLLLLGTYACAFGIANIGASLKKRSGNRERVFLEGIGDGVCSLDTNGIVTLWNRGAQIISGQEEGAVIGQHYSSMFHFPLSSSRIIDDILNGKQSSSRLDARLAREKDELPISLLTSPLKDDEGAITGAFLFFNDASKEQQLNSAKNEFVSLASHQLRTPLTALQWYLELLLEGDAGALRPKQKDLLKRAYRQGKRMAGLITAFLNVSRIEMGSLSLSPQDVRLPLFIKDILNDFSYDIQKKKLKLTLSVNKKMPTVVCDPLVVRVVLENLVSNAIAYTPLKGTITVKAEASDQSIEISVRDTGCGIPLKDQERIFTKLFRAENVRTLEPDGNGLGLHIVKGLIDACHGSISFSSQEGKGTEFVVSIPLAMKKRDGTRSLTPRFR